MVKRKKYFLIDELLPFTFLSIQFYKSPNTFQYFSFRELTFSNMSNGKKVGVVGSGLVGKSWAMIFASQGYQVKLLFYNN